MADTKEPVTAAGLRAFVEQHKHAAVAHFTYQQAISLLTATAEQLDANDREEERNEIREPLTPSAETDGAAPEIVIAAVLRCARAWEPAARIIGNVRAGDIIHALVAAEAQTKLSERNPWREALLDLLTGAEVGGDDLGARLLRKALREADAAALLRTAPSKES